MHLTIDKAAIDSAMRIPRTVFHALGYSGAIAIGLMAGFLLSAAQIDTQFLAEQTAALATIIIIILGVSKAFKGASHQSIAVLGVITSAQIAYWLPVIDVYIVGVMVDIALVSAAFYIYGFRRKKHGNATKKGP